MYTLANTGVVYCGHFSWCGKICSFRGMYCCPSWIGSSKE